MDSLCFGFICSLFWSVGCNIKLCYCPHFTRLSVLFFGGNILSHQQMSFSVVKKVFIALEREFGCSFLLGCDHVNYIHKGSQQKSICYPHLLHSVKSQKCVIFYISCVSFLLFVSVCVSVPLCVSVCVFR